jgi:hypothetical protein
MALPQQMVGDLEELVDASSLSAVIEALALMCREKADHLRSNWQDKNAARTWERDARKLDMLAAKIEN